MEPLSVPPILRAYRLSACLPYDAAQALSRQGISVLGDLEGRTLYELAQLQNVGSHRAQQVAVALQQLLVLVGSDLAKLSPAHFDGRPPVPNLPPAMLALLLGARSLATEAEALMYGLSQRDAAIVSDMWSFKRGSRPTLEEVGRKHGITRERTRQVLAKREKFLAGSGLMLPIGSAVIDVLDRAGGALPTPEVISRCRERGVEVDRLSLSVLPSLARIGVVDRVFWSEEYKLWLSAKGIEAWLGGGTAQITKARRAEAWKELGRIGAVETQRLAELSPHGLQHGVWLLLRRQERVMEVGNYTIPVPSGDSTLAGTVRKMLAVTPTLSMTDVFSGLERAHRVRPTPPLEVVRSVLQHHPSFVVNGDAVRSRAPLDRRSVLSDGELTAVELFEREGGVLLWAEAMDGLVAAGLSKATAALLLVGPLLVRRFVAIYTLRGREVDANLLRKKKRIWRESREENVIHARWEGADRLVARIRLTRFTLQGVLPTPPELKPVRREWRARFPDGRQSTVKVTRNFIWPVHRWLQRCEAAEGDLIVATFFLAEGLIEFDHVQANRGGH